MVYEKETERGLSRQTVADWTGRVLEWMMQVDDDGQIDRQMRLQLMNSTYSTTIDVPDELFGDPNALGAVHCRESRRCILAACRDAQTSCTRDLEVIGRSTTPSNLSLHRLDNHQRPCGVCHARCDGEQRRAC